MPPKQPNKPNSRNSKDPNDDKRQDKKPDPEQDDQDSGWETVGPKKRQKQKSQTPTPPVPEPAKLPPELRASREIQDRMNTKVTEVKTKGDVFEERHREADKNAEDLDKHKAKDGTKPRSDKKKNKKEPLKGTKSHAAISELCNARGGRSGGQGGKRGGRDKGERSDDGSDKDKEDGDGSDDGDGSRDGDSTDNGSGST
ncbi:hypothetical protein P280DRAFT_548490 [Massarina eburnea CBS 473.64]|uniref:Uncharacterized protein n=1 Tax=Massarina eburnea CBS 473.64 TaxID=1395130 RepID=A0A6A6S2V8_9PLEO|nr:hypothetical protein P280DRAFT_548490 [Massarina eburnea CBS 473.64]